MSTDTGIGAIKLPNDAQLRGAIEEYVAAIALAARRRELISAAQASISEADAEVTRTHERCVELGIIPGGRRAAAKSSTTRPPRQHGENSVRARALQTVRDAATGGSGPTPLTANAVAERIGASPTSAASALLELTNAGDLQRVKNDDGKWQYSPIGGEQ